MPRLAEVGAGTDAVHLFQWGPGSPCLAHSCSVVLRSLATSADIFLGAHKTPTWPLPRLLPSQSS